jgi:hypothetical protein
MELVVSSVLIVTLIFGCVIVCKAVSWMIAFSASGLSVGRVSLGALMLLVQERRVVWRWSRRTVLHRVGEVTPLGEPSEPSTLIAARFRRAHELVGPVHVGVSVATVAAVYFVLRYVMSNRYMESATIWLILALVVATVRIVVTSRAGAQWWNTLSPQTEHELAVMSVIWDDIRGKRPRNWSAHRLSYILTDHAEVKRSVQSMYLAFHYLLDSGQTDLAWSQMCLVGERLHEVRDRVWTDAVRDTAAWFAAYVLHDLAEAQKWLSNVSRDATPGETALSRAAICLRLGDCSGALAAAEEGLLSMHTAISDSIRIVYGTLLDQLRLEALECVQQPDEEWTTRVASSLQ